MMAVDHGKAGESRASDARGRRPLTLSITEGSGTRQIDRKEFINRFDYLTLSQTIPAHFEQKRERKERERQEERHKNEPRIPSAAHESFNDGLGRSERSFHKRATDLYRSKFSFHLPYEEN